MAAYRVSGLRIPLRDGITLGADLYTPAGESKGLLLTRGPYGRGRMIARRMAGPWAAQGWTVLFVSSRGTADSGGQFDPMRTEQADGQDVAAWMREQAWYPGRFATVGGSYLGYTQWAMLADPPADLVAAVVLMGPHDFSRHAWGTGTFTLDLFGWTEQTVVLGGRGILRTILGMITANRRLRPVLQATPTVDAAVAHFGDAAPWLRDRLVRDDLADPYWAPMQHAEALERTDIPVLILGGWQDIFLRQSIQQYRRLRERGVETALTVGPWTHLDLTGAAAKVTTVETLAWLDAHVAGIPGPARMARVRVYDKGTDAWVERDDWPAASTTRTLYFDGAALAEAPGTARERRFVYDPADPTPTVGGNIISGGGYVEDGRLADRGDTLVYSTAVLEEDVVVRGAPIVELEHAAEHPDADLFARISDVDPRGRSHNVAEGCVRLRGDANGPVRVELLDTAYTFRAGHRIRLVLAGGSFPLFARSAGTGENPLTAAALVPNTHTVTEGTLTLPVA
nr:CocE/NonD family hydrolase [Microbacterium bovistercoris]